MADDFSWKRDFKNVDWQSTLKYNLIRSAAAGVVWGIVMSVFAPAGNAPVAFALLSPIIYPLVLPIGYLIFFLPLGLLMSFVARLPIPCVGLITGCMVAMFSLIIAVGDPLVHFLSKKKPEWIPVDHPGLFSFRLIIFIIRDPSQPRATRAPSPAPPPQPTAPDMPNPVPSPQVVAPSGQHSTAGFTASATPTPPATMFFRSKPFILLVVAAVLLCSGIALVKSFAQKTVLSFALSLDGKALPSGRRPDVRVDGQPFATGSKIGVGRHEITVQLQDAEPLDKHFWVLFGAKDLGTVPLESSKGSLAVAVNPSPANVVVRRGGETLSQGDAPLTVDKLPIGDYTLLIRRGEYEERQSANVRRQERTEAKIDLKLGSADLSAEPADAEFELSGGGRHWQGKLPTRLNDVPVGSYSLVARRKGWELTGQLSVSRGNVASNRIDFPYGLINVTSDPSGLAVSTNGVEAGKTPVTFRELRPGSYEVAATDGENILTATVTVGPKEEVKKQFLFRYGAVQLASTPPGAAVFRYGKEIGKTPLTLARLPAGSSPVELRFDGYAPTNFTIVGLEGVTTNYSVKLASERYLQAMKQAREALNASQLAESQKFLASALEAEPNDSAALALREDVSKATLKSEESRKEAERKAQEAERAAKHAQQKEQADANARALASLAWLDFQKVIFDCTDTKQVQYAVQLDDGYYENYTDGNGKTRRRFHKTGQHTEMRTRIESTFSPTKFSQQYEGKTFRFNCPDKWAVTKIEKEGGIVLRAGGGLASDEIRATPPTSNPDALKSLQKGQKVSFKGVLKKYDKGILVRTLYLEDAEILTQ